MVAWCQISGQCFTDDAFTLSSTISKLTAVSSPVDSLMFSWTMHVDASSCRAWLVETRSCQAFAIIEESGAQNCEDHTRCLWKVVCVSKLEPIWTAVWSSEGNSNSSPNFSLLYDASLPLLSGTSQLLTLIWKRSSEKLRNRRQKQRPIPMY